MADRFEYSVYLGFNATETSAANQIIEAFKKDGLRVCHDELEPRSGESPLQATERFIRTSRTFVLLISKATLGNGWPSLERRTVQFRDPKDPKRRFIPVLLDDCKDLLPEAFRQYGFIDLTFKPRKSIERLVTACRSASNAVRKAKSHRIAILDFALPNSHDVADISESHEADALLIAAGQEIDFYDLGTFSYENRFATPRGRIKCVSISPDGDKLAVGMDNSTLAILQAKRSGFRAGASIKHLPLKHQGEVVCVEWSQDGKTLYSTGGDASIRLWELNTRNGQREIYGHRGGIGQISISPDGKRAVSASYDNSLKIWDLETRSCLGTFGDHGFPINSAVWLPDGKHLLSGSDECTVRLWDVDSQSCLVSMEGHRDSIWRVAYSNAARIAASGSWDNTVRLWEVWSGRCLQVLKFKDLVNFVRFSQDGKRLYIGAGETLYVHRFNQALLKKLASLDTDTRRYSNAKVVLVGESMAGKTHLAHRLVEDNWVPIQSTHGMRVWPLKIKPIVDQTTDREVWLWDLAGQPDYRLVHQIFLDETSLALVVFDPSNEDAFHKLKHWEMSLRQAVGHDPAKILVSSKSDVSGSSIAPAKMKQLVQDRGYSVHVATSAYTGSGRAELLDAISNFIPWERTPSITTPRLFKVLKDGIVQIKDQGLVMIQFAALKQQLQLANPKERFEEADLRTVVRLLAGQGLIKPLKFGDVVLLKPELLNNYAAAVAREAREHAEGLGCVEERRVLNGEFDFRGMVRASKAEEDILLRAVVETYVDRSLCIRQATSEGDTLVFPSHYNLDAEIHEQPPDFVVYQFAGNLGNIYTTLVVRLRYTQGFEEPRLFRNAAVFLTNEGDRMGFSFHSDAHGTGELRIFFDVAVPEDTRVTFLRYVHEHLLKHAIDVQRQRRYACPDRKCGKPFESLEALRLRRMAGESYIRCVYCDARIPIVDLVEKKFQEERFHRKVRELDEKASIRLVSESKELLLVGHAYAAAAEANQIFRVIHNSDQGIDGEIEFRNDRGEASGQRVYVQLKSGGSHTYERLGDGQEIFTVKKRRHLQYWQEQLYPVYLVVLDQDGSARWMNVTRYLKGRQNKDSLQIEFNGDPFDAYSILRLATSLVP